MSATYFSRVLTSCNQPTSTLPAQAKLGASGVMGPNGGVVRLSRHLWISEWPSANEKPHARAWYIPGRSPSWYCDGSFGYPLMIVMKLLQLTRSSRMSRKTKILAGTVIVESLG